jgi:acetyl esterase
MSYAFDPELAAAIPMMPKADVTDLTAAKAEAEKFLRPILEQMDTTGVEIGELHVPGPAGAPDVRLITYRPQGVTGPLPVVYDIHGGGFVLGTPEMNLPSNLAFARQLGALVVSVDYRLAPDHPFPAPVEDCYAGLTWVVAHAAELGADPDRVAVHGQSAGGGLAAALTLLARDRGGPAIRFQYLGIPAVDDRLDTPSMLAYIDTPVWNRPNAVLSWAAYLGAGLPGTDDVSAYAAPARAKDLCDLPPAYVSVMQFDPLRDEGIQYAQSLLAAGVRCELHLFPGTFHASAMVPYAEVSQREAAEAIAVLHRALS